MKFRTELNIKPAPFQISPFEGMVFIGSCFSDHMGERFRRLGIPLLTNPFGVIFHPLPLLEIVLKALDPDFSYSAVNLLHYENRFYSLAHHGSYSDKSEEILLEKLNRDIGFLREGLADCKLLCLTLGTSFGYEREGRVVANCHKLPQSFFQKKLSSSAVIEKKLEEVIEALHRKNPSLKIVLTVSPVRHVKDGLVENNRSKAQLLTAVHNLCESIDNAFYFPSYELVVDDLRDYRFFKKDLVHPSDIAVDYVQEAFLKFVFDDKSIEVIVELQKFQLFQSHKVSSENKEIHELKVQEKKSELKKKYPKVEV